MTALARPRTSFQTKFFLAALSAALLALAVAARQTGLGRSRRYSATLKIDMLYVATPVAHPAIAVVRLALPLTDISHQLQPILTVTLTALAVALAGGAASAWILSRRIGQR